MNIDKYLDIFLSESSEYLEKINNSLVELEKKSDPDVINNIFRFMHTLKGMAATMEFSRMATLSHLMEDLLDDIRSSKLELSDTIFDCLFSGADIISEMINSIKDHKQDDINFSELESAINDIIKGKRGAAPTGDEKEKTGKEVPVDDTEQEVASGKIKFNEYELNTIREGLEQKYKLYFIKVTLEESCQMKSVRAFMLFQKLEGKGEVVKTVPAPEKIEEERFGDSFIIFFMSRLIAHKVKSFIGLIREIKSVDIKRVDIDLQEIDRILKVGSISSKNNKQETKKEKVVVSKDKAQNSKAKSIKKDTEKVKEKVEKYLSSEPIQSIKVKVKYLDDMVNLVGELIINRIQLQDIAKNNDLKILEDNLNKLTEISGSLQEYIMQARMVPVGQVFDRFPRMVRDLSKEANKEVTLELFGRDIELDRTILDEIDKPLVHIIRNSIDHGIEPPAERVKRGKKKTGVITLGARRDRNFVVIEISDDGNGIDVNAIKKKAVQKGLVEEEEISKLSKQDIISYIYKPGFSTSEKITKVSGRGVGMDVVKNKVEALSGLMNIETEVGKGTIISIRLPLTLAIIQALIVKVCDQTFIMPTSNIKETLELHADNIKTIKKREAVILRNEEIIPIIRINKILGLEDLDQDKKFIAVVEMGEKKAGLVFNVLLEQYEIVIKNLDPELRRIKYFSGIAILADGRPSLILDIPAFLSSY